MDNKYKGRLDRAFERKSKRILSNLQRTAIETRLRIERDFDEWLKTMDPSDSKTQEILKRLALFESKFSIWRAFGRNNDVARSRAMDNIFNR